MGLVVVDIARREVIPFIEGSAVAQQLANHVVAGLGQHPMDVKHLPTGGFHLRQVGAAQLAEIDHRGGGAPRQIA